MTLPIATCQFHKEEIPCWICEDKEPLKPKTQIVYVPTHLKGLPYKDPKVWNYPYGPQPGFIVKRVKPGHYFCRYFMPSEQGGLNFIKLVDGVEKLGSFPELRTTANSEMTHVSMIRVYSFMNHEIIDAVIRQYEIKIGEVNVSA